MIVEHSFVTTLSADAAFALAGALLSQRGFALDSASTAQAHQWRRGRASAGGSRSTLTLPQRIRMEFDRGRISVGAAVELDRRRWKWAERVIVAYPAALEQAISSGLEVAAALAPIQALERRIRNRERLAAGIFLTIVALVIGSVVWAVLHAASR